MTTTVAGGGVATQPRRLDSIASTSISIGCSVIHFSIRNVTEKRIDSWRALVLTWGRLKTTPTTTSCRRRRGEEEWVEAIKK